MTVPLHDGGGSDKIKARILREAGIDPDTPSAATEVDIAALTAAAKRSPQRG